MSVLIYVKKNTRLHILFVTTKHINLELKLRCEIVKSVIKDWKKFLHSVTIDFIQNHVQLSGEVTLPFSFLTLFFTGVYCDFPLASLCNKTLPKGSTLGGKNLLLGEQILSFKS